MGWLHKHLGFGKQSTQSIRDRLGQLQFRIPEPETPLREVRFVSIDLETSGLDLQNDEILSIGAVALGNLNIKMNDQFECVVNQNSQLATQAVLIHGITPGQLQQGVRPEDALFSLLDYMEDAVCLAFHAGFDETMLKRAYKHYLGFPFAHRFIDIAQLAPAVMPNVKARSLDNWVHHFQIHMPKRHHACADALATAQLFQILVAHGLKKGATLGDLQVLVRRHLERKALYQPR